MNRVSDVAFFGLVHDFFKIYLPKQRGSSPHTIRSYQTALDTLLDFIKNEHSVISRCRRTSSLI